MINKLFSYGTLQQESVQLENFGRKLVGHSDALMSYEIRNCLINDSKVVNLSGKNIHPIACFTGNFNHEVPGNVFEITEEELYEADKYEVDDYKRIKCILKSGEHAWVYVQNGLNIDINKLQLEDVKLEMFDDKHTAALCEKAQDERIWKHHRCNFHFPEIFKLTGIEAAKKDIKNKTRYKFIICYKNEIIGSTSYYDVDLKHLTMYIGYSWLHPNYWGKGINAIVKKLLLTYAFDELKFKRVSFCIDSENLRSRAAVEKLHIPFEGISKKHQIRPDGTSRDSALYAITDDVWRLQFIK